MNYKFVWVDTASGIDRQQWVLSPPVTIGRCPTAEITLSDGSISRKHCQFLIDPYGSLVVRDLGSKNGVYVDDRRVEKAVLLPGSEVKIGVITLRVEMTDEAIDQIDEPESAFDLEVYDLGETQPVKIIPPTEDVG
ncbi:FHA domain-containing protein [Stieleria sp.]|uniref:Glycogen accumulation regulator GarA n=1 Tax=Stieleria magnilauensis TaxID=2527963 RepID=A0ABX5XR20_9BACT|nr:Glycogen accumulation regulator GarA [Planctomycetes bacterium TBK1r]